MFPAPTPVPIPTIDPTGIAVANANLVEGLKEAAGRFPLVEILSTVLLAFLFWLVRHIILARR